MEPRTRTLALVHRVKDRDLAVDYYRVSGVVLIVLGHWLAAAITYHDGHFGRQNPLVDQPWTEWLTWIFQAVPVFFLVAGYAGAVSWKHRYEGDSLSRQTWLRRRLARVLGPTAVYVAFVAVAVAILQVTDVAGAVLEYAGWAVAMHLWFLAVYVMVVSLTPIGIAAQRRWGLRVPALLAVAVAAVDAVSLAGDLHFAGWANYLLCWAALYQLGIAWRGGLLTPRRAIILAAVSGVVLALLIWPGPYPVSMIGVPGQALQNTTPPSLAMLAFGCMQAGVAVAVAPVLNRWLRAEFVKRFLSVANTNIMALYLWHMLPVVIVAIIAYPAGLLPQPPEQTIDWWLGRLEWWVILGLVTALELALLWWGRRVFAAPLPNFELPLAARWTEPIMSIGTAAAAYALAFLAALGFAPDGHLPVLTVLVFASGLTLMALRPATARHQ